MESIQVEVTLLGFLRAAAGSDCVVLHLPPGITVRSTLGELNLKRDVVLTVVVNDVVAGIDTVLQDGDKVRLIPYTGGG
jgi:molybdopterin converting factor small subunit